MSASHYVKMMLDMIFGMDNFRNEIVWAYTSGGASSKEFAKKHDIIFKYSKSNSYLHNETKYKRYVLKDEKGKEIGFDPRVEYFKDDIGSYRINNMTNVWSDIGIISPNSKTERLGYPTQKPEKLLERIILASTN